MKDYILPDFIGGLVVIVSIITGTWEIVFPLIVIGLILYISLVG